MCACFMVVLCNQTESWDLYTLLVLSLSGDGRVLKENGCAKERGFEDEVFVVCSVVRPSRGLNAQLVLSLPGAERGPK